MNATTPFERWEVFQKTLKWAITASELADGRLQDLNRTREEFSKVCLEHAKMVKG